MRVSKRKINSTLETRLVKTLVQAICDFKDKEETEIFLKDFFTEIELATFSKRLAIAYWLRNKRSYENIVENLKVSSATVGQVKEILDKKGIKLALKKIEAEEWADKWSGRIRKYVVLK